MLRDTQQSLGCHSAQRSFITGAGSITYGPGGCRQPAKLRVYHNSERYSRHSACTLATGRKQAGSMIASGSCSIYTASSLSVGVLPRRSKHHRCVRVRVEGSPPPASLCMTRVYVLSMPWIWCQLVFRVELDLSTAAANAPFAHSHMSNNPASSISSYVVLLWRNNLQAKEMTGRTWSSTTRQEVCKCPR